MSICKQTPTFSLISNSLIIQDFRVDSLLGKSEGKFYQKYILLRNKQSISHSINMHLINSSIYFFPFRPPGDISELYLLTSTMSVWGFPGGTVVKNPPANAGDTGSTPGPGRPHMPRSD